MASSRGVITAFCQYRHTVLFFDQTCRYHSLTESRHIHFLTKSLQSLFYFFLIISFFDLDSKHCAYAVYVLQ